MVFVHVGRAFEDKLGLCGCNAFLRAFAERLLAFCVNSIQIFAFTALLFEYMCALRPEGQACDSQKSKTNHEYVLYVIMYDSILLRLLRCIWNRLTSIVT